jgi:3-methyladenine DNA glycosylase Tag
LEDAMATGSIIKNWRKVKAIRSNAQWFTSILEEHGSIGGYLLEVQPDRYFEQLYDIQKGGTNVGIRTLQIWFRRMGLDAFVFSMDVERVLKMYGVISEAPTSKKSWVELQEQVNLWREEGKYSLANISQIMAFSLGTE